MFCEGCGEENESAAKFCKGCGNPLNSGSDQSSKITQGDKEAVSDSNETIEIKEKINQIIGKFKKLPKKLQIGTFVAIVAIFVVICIAMNSSSTINLNKYLTIEAEGYNGYGTARAKIDWDEIQKKYGSKLSFSSQAKKEYGQLLSMTTPLEVMEEYISVELEENSSLKNDKKISYRWNVNDKLSSYVKCKVKYKDDSYKVVGLTEVGTFDAFDGIEVVYTGIAPAGHAEISYTGDLLNSYDFSCDESSRLSNGDTITVSLTNANMEYYIKLYGKIPKATEKIYTVDGLDKYVGQYSDISDDFLLKVKAEAEDTIYSHTAGSYNNDIKMNDLEYVGYIMLTLADAASYADNYNNLYLIYKGNVSGPEGKFVPTDVYYPVKFSDILLSNDTLSFKNNNGILGTFSFENTWYSSKGYKNPLVCYMDIVESNADRYTAECGDGFEQYGKYEMISKLSDISEENKNLIYEDAKKIIETYIKSDYNNGSMASELTVAGEYMLVAKESMSNYAENNAYIVVFSTTVSNRKGNFDSTTVYFPVEFDGIVKMDSGDYIILSAKGIQGKTSFPDSFYSTKGFIEGTTMFDKIVNANRDNYTYEISDGLQQFGK